MTGSTPSRRSSLWFSGSVLLLLAVGGYLGLKASGIDLAALTPEQIRRGVLSFGVLSPLAYLLVYGQPIIPLPAMVMTVAAGLAFGPWWGSGLAVLGSMIRACGQFLIAKRLGRKRVEHLLKGRLSTFDQRIGDRGFAAVLVVRLVPNLPFDIQNFGLGFSRVGFGAYSAATLLGLLPWTIPLVYFGDSLTDLRQIWKLLGLLLLITACLLAVRAWAARRRQT